MLLEYHGMKGLNDREKSKMRKGIKFNALQELQIFLVDYIVRFHRSLIVVYSDKILRYM